MERQSDYLIIGAGLAASTAAMALRESDPGSTITLLGDEHHPPYDRPPLSKALWKDAKEQDIWRPMTRARATIELGRHVVAIDRAAHQVRDDAGDLWKYRKLLIATGGSPRRLPFGDDIIYFRTIDDYRKLRAKAQPGTRIAVIGGGFIGSEIAAALSWTGCKVTMLFPEDTIGARPYPKALAQFMTGYFRDKGIDVRSGITASGMTGADTLTLSDGSALSVDAVVAGIGITPNLELARDAGLETGNGIVVDAHLRTSDPDIYAAGDVAEFPAPSLERRLRAEHENAAAPMGECAGRNMAGKDAPYDVLPYFYSDLFDLGYEAVGVLDARMETVEQWVTPYREGVVYYLEHGRVRGVLLWNTWGQVDAARALIADPGPFDAQKVRGRLPAA